ncbi:MAG: hypothetical protein JWM17_2909 [Actinobacteria bacterium]|jgi:hypothetical protein|nr:hypothetical protein [Actinomycetota bacterium]
MTTANSGRFAHVDRSEVWGYVVWGAMALVIAIPEITAAVDHKVPWPTISGMTGHLEYRWSWVALIVVALIVFAAFHSVTYRWSLPGDLATQANQRKLRRTPAGRLTRALDESSGSEKDELSTRWLLIAFAVVAVGGLLAARLKPHGKFFLGYVLYGLIAVVWVVVPNVLAFWFAKDVAFPTLFRTVAYLERRLHFVAVILLVGYVILLIHLALYPWPNIFHQLRPAPSVHSP